jgi:hypothetical protein
LSGDWLYLDTIFWKKQGKHLSIINKLKNHPFKGCKPLKGWEIQRLDEIVSLFHENKLKSVIDFASYLKDSEEAEELLRMQMSSQAYSDWLSSENDIYDEMFKSQI